MASEFDFIIVGGGTAGLALAARLSEDPKVQVLVIEAGEDLTTDPRVNVPAMWPTLQGASSDWAFKTVPQKGLGGRELHVPQGRMLGGSSALNSMNFVVSSKANLDAWAQLGNPGWDWSSFSKSFRQAYSLTTPSQGTEREGPIQATVPGEDSKWPQVWRDAFSQLGFPGDKEPFSGKVCGAVMYPDAIDPTTKQRSFAGNAYLGPARSRTNLTVWTGILVERVAFDTSNSVLATGVQYTKHGKSETVSARKEVVISAGAINSPKILELSGVGDARLLHSLGIEVVIDNPHVGENLQNHLMCIVCFETADEEGFDTIDTIARQEPAALSAAMEAYARQSGPFSKTNANHMAHLPFPGITTGEGQRDLMQILSNAKAADDDLGKTTPAFAKMHEAFVRSVLTSPTEASGYCVMCPGWGFYDSSGRLAPIPPGTEKYMSVGLMLAHPLSRGSVHIGAASASNPQLAIDPNHLAHPLDMEVMARHIRFLESTVVATEPLAGRLKPGGKRSPRLPAGPRGFAEAGEDAGLDAARQFVRDTAVGANHYTSTCSMMPRELGGVVDPQLRVYGCRNLRVCDASIMPLTPHANPMATVYGIAEKAAEMIKAGL